MSRGVQISAAIHGLLAMWVLFGGAFRANPPELTVADVTVLSEEQFAALTAPTTEQPAPTPEPPTPTAAPEPEPPTPAPDPEPPAPEPKPAPDPEPTPQPEPQPAPEVTPPAPVQEAVPQPAPPETAPPVSAPDVSTRPVPRPAPRVAPEPVAPPPPDASVDDTVQQAADPDTQSPDQAEAQQDQTAPEEAATEIVTEAEKPASAPTRSLRPQARPQRAAQATPDTPAPDAPAPDTQAAEAKPDTAPEDTQDDIAAALAEALAGGGSPTADPGPPLTRGEREGLRLAVQQCWVVDVGSQAANVSVTLGFDMDPDGTVIASSLRMVDASGGSGAAVETAFQAARRALLRCQKGGYDLPTEKYEQWKEIEMTFNPAQMRLR